MKAAGAFLAARRSRDQRPISGPHVFQTGDPMKRFNFWREVTTDDGDPVTFLCRDGMLTVRTRHGSKTAQIGNLPVKTLAKIMLRAMKDRWQ